MMLGRGRAFLFVRKGIVDCRLPIADCDAGGWQQGAR
jgi:hypothetical protein